MRNRFIILAVAAAGLSAWAAPSASAEGVCGAHALPPTTDLRQHSATAEISCAGVGTIDWTLDVCLERLVPTTSLFTTVGCTGTGASDEDYVAGLYGHSQPCQTTGNTAGLHGTGIYRTHAYVSYNPFIEFKADPLGNYAVSEPVPLACQQ